MKKFLSLLLCGLIVLSGIGQAAVCFASQPDFIASDANVTVQVTADGAFPDSTEMKIATVNAGDDFISVDISFVCNGEEVEPQKEVSVSMTYTRLSGEEFEVSHNGEVIDTATSTNAEFETDSFSIYTISEVKVDTYNFYDGDTLLSSQRVKTGETVYAPAVSGEKGIFAGWKSDETDYGDFETYIAGEASGKTISLYSYYKDSLVHVYYMDGNRILATLSGYKGETVTLDNGPTVSISPTEKFTGWYFDEACTKPASGELVLEKDVYLYPRRISGHWLSFDTDGGNFIDPVFVTDDEVTTEPGAPVKPGYTFTGWQLDGQPYEFNQNLTEDTTLKAVYEAAQTPYTIILWQQSASDLVGDKPTYEYYSSVQKTGITDSQTVVDETYTSYTFEGFHYSKTEGDTTIKGDGSSIVNVYYDRNVITLNFYRNTTGFGTPETVLQGLYGTTLEQNGYTQPEPLDGYMWSYLDFNNSTVFVSQISTFGYTTAASRDTGVSNYIFALAGNYRYYYYMENLNDLAYSTDDLTNFSDSGALLTVSRNKIKGVVIGDKHQGFSPCWVKFRDYSGANQSRAVSKGEIVYNVLLNSDYPLIIYFKRNIYTVDFINGAETTSKDVLYDDSLSKLLFTPECPYTTGNWAFDGWYTDDTYYNQFNFNSRMPAYSLRLYAKWVPVKYTIRIHGIDGSVFDTSELEYGDKITHNLFPSVLLEGTTVEQGNGKIYELPADSKWYGWADENGNAVHYGQEVTHDMDYYPRYFDKSHYAVIYHSGENTTYSDSVYAPGASARISGNIFGKEGFTGWNTKEDGTGDTYLSNDSYTFGEADLELYAQYRQVNTDKTLLVYHSGNETYTEEYRVNDQVTIKPCMFTKEGYLFKGWVDENHRQISGTVIIDGARNDLYAVWEKAPSASPAVSSTTSQPPKTGDTIYWHLAWLLASLLGVEAMFTVVRKQRSA